MRDWFSSFRSGGSSKNGVFGVLGVTEGNSRLKTSPYGSSFPEHLALGNVSRCTESRSYKNSYTPGTPETFLGVRSVDLEKPHFIKGLSKEAHLKHLKHQEKPGCGKAREGPDSKSIPADQLSPAERTLFCLDHELTLPGALCGNKNRLERCYLWKAITGKRPVPKPQVPCW